MARHRDRLPQLDGSLFLTDGGIETTLVFHGGWELPDFAAFDLFRRPGGEAALREYYLAYAAIAARHQAGLVLESATWRASADWGRRIGYSRGELAEANRRAIRLLAELRDGLGDEVPEVVISGCVGPRGDGYVPAETMTGAAAERYHREQVETFAATEADMVAAITMNYVEEAVGIARAAESAGLPAAISFTVETDGRLPSGQPLRDAVEEVDEATRGYPAYYMINCAHPTHFAHVLDTGEPWAGRIRGLRANASRQSHAELNESPVLDAGDPAELGEQYAALSVALPWLTVLGGCCGTDHRHLERIAGACAPLFPPRVPVSAA